MQKVLTAAQMREVDRQTTTRYGVPSITLMENAARAVVQATSERLGGSVEGKRILVLCGKGNNGGDGAAIARQLSERGARVFVAVFGSVSDTTGDALTNFERLRSLKDINLNETAESVDPDNFDVVVDALFGTGITRKLEGVFETQVNIVNNWRHRHSGSLIVSVDLPSGLNADSPEPLGACIEADLTVTFTAPKVANIMPPASRSNGKLVVADIGSPQSLIGEQPSQLFVTEKEDAASWLKRTEFSSDSYKNKRGHALIVAGSENYSGAAVLAGNSAMRSGVGLVTIVTPRSSKESVAARVLPEVMVRGGAETDGGALGESAFDEIADLLEKADSITIGSGLSIGESTRRLVEKVTEATDKPVIVDADALTMLSPFEETPFTRGIQRLVLTPHEGEFLRLLGTQDKDTIKDRIAAVREFAGKNKVILVLKGERVLIGEPGGKVAVNPTGNAGLGKAGNGDTLTGLLCGFTAQSARFGLDLFETVVAAVYLAGLAGDITERKFGKRVMTASDVRECLSEAFNAVGAS
jgi:NAD(P)H-hydrate epimerase